MKKVLLVDDEPEITDNLALFLKAAGFSVSVAADGVEGLDLASKDRPDVIVLDREMPRMDGGEMLRQLRKTGNMTPVIFLTKYSDVHLHILGISEGANAYLSKPFNSTLLLTYIQALLGHQPPSDGGPRLVSGELTFYVASKRVTLGDQTLSLGPLEKEILEYLMRHPGKLLTWDAVYVAVWKSQRPVDGARLVQRHLAEVRRELQDDAVGWTPLSRHENGVS